MRESKKKKTEPTQTEVVEAEIVYPDQWEPEFNDFVSGKVFDFILSKPTPYEQKAAERRMADLAVDLKFKKFTSLFQLYKAERKKEVSVVQRDAMSEVEGLEVQLKTGEWNADETGIVKVVDAHNLMVACSHPIVPVRRLRSIDTKELKYTLAFRRGKNKEKPFEYIDINAADMASPTEIVKILAPRGVSVSGGDRAKALVDFLRDVTDLNYEELPEIKSVSRLGWNEDGFAPYNKGVVFDGAQAFSGAYRALCEVGDFEKWKAEAISCRQYSITARIVLAASFAAPLIEKLGVLPFFVHLWSVESATGKTVAQMLGASVWGNPTPGSAFFPTFRSTSVGLELIAGFLHSIPVFLDELQLAKDSHGNVNFNVYELASGSGKLRGNKQLGLNYTPTWSTTFITSGETPIVKETDGEGALNRVFEIECYSGQKVVEDGHRTANILKANYGYAGKMFVEKLMEDGAVDRARLMYEQFYSDCIQSDTTEKQAMAASAILVADALATEWIFQDHNALILDDIAEYLKTKERVSLLDRGYDMLCDWVSINANKLKGLDADSKGECFGIIDEATNVAYIVRKKFADVCAEFALDERGMLSHLRTKGLLHLTTKGYSIQHHIGPSTRANCIGLVLPVRNSDEDETYQRVLPDQMLPF